MSEYQKKEDVIKALEHSRGASDYLIDILAEIECVPTADVVEVSKILKTADEQEKQGFIQTAKVLRELVSNEQVDEGSHL